VVGVGPIAESRHARDGGSAPAAIDRDGCLNGPRGRVGPLGGIRRPRGAVHRFNRALRRVRVVTLLWVLP
jgi:hypothetical protein